MKVHELIEILRHHPSGLEVVLANPSSDHGTDAIEAVRTVEEASVARGKSPLGHFRKLSEIGPNVLVIFPE